MISRSGRDAVRALSGDFADAGTQLHSPELKRTLPHFKRE